MQAVVMDRSPWRQSEPAKEPLTMPSTPLKKNLWRAVLVVALCAGGYGLAKLPVLVVGRSLRHEQPVSRPERVASPSAALRPAAPERVARPADDNADAATSAVRDKARANKKPNQDIYTALKTVIDPEVRLSVVDLGLIRRIDRHPNGGITVTMTLTSPLCPYLKELMTGIRQAVQPFAPQKEVRVEIDLSRHWSPADLSPEGRRKLFGARP
jgi:metal-sulfur cluster biosynthetic enzyme